MRRIPPAHPAFSDAPGPQPIIVAYGRPPAARFLAEPSPGPARMAVDDLTIRRHLDASLRAAAATWGRKAVPS